LPVLRLILAELFADFAAEAIDFDFRPFEGADFASSFWAMDTI
jgi:hypothetical protein